MSDSIEPNDTAPVVETHAEITPDVQALIDKSLAAKEDTFKRELAGLNKKNSELTNLLNEKDSASKTVEERVAAIEKERDTAKSRAATVEAFAHVGLQDDWRVAIDNPNPVERAQAIKDLLAIHVENVGRDVAAKLGQGDDVVLGGSKRTYKMEELKGKDPATINKLFDEGRIAG